MDRRFWNDAIHSWFCSVINAHGKNLVHTFSSINFATLLETWHTLRWKGGQFWQHLSLPPYLQWNELNIGKLWGQSVLEQYAFGIICSVSGAFLWAFVQNITVMLHKTLIYTNNVEWRTWPCVLQRFFLNSPDFVWQMVPILLLQ
jgi:hypothetical protein